MRWSGVAATAALVCLGAGTVSGVPPAATAPPAGDTVSSRVIDALVGALADPDPSVRRSAVNSLRDLADPRGIEALHRVLDDPDPDVRRAARVVLGLEDARPNMRVPTGTPATPDPAELRHLEEALSDPDPDVRHTAAHALGNAGSRASVPALIRAWPDPDDHVRGAVASALGAIGDTRAVPVLVEAVADPVAHVRQVAAEALGKMRRGGEGAPGGTGAAPTEADPGPAPPAGSELPRPPVCDPEATTGPWTPATLEEASAVLLQDADPARREAAARAIGRLAGSEGAGEEPRWIDAAAAPAPGSAKDPHHALVAGVSDPATAVRLAAICSLGRVGDGRALEALRWRTTPESDPAVRRAAEWAASRIRSRAGR